MGMGGLVAGQLPLRLSPWVGGSRDLGRGILRAGEVGR